MATKKRGSGARISQNMASAVKAGTDVRNEYIKKEMARASGFGGSSHSLSARQGAAKRVKQAGGTGRYGTTSKDITPRKIKAAPKRGRNK